MLRDPVVVFFAIGSLFFALFALLNREDVVPVVLSEGGRALLVNEWEMLTGRAADAVDVQRIVDNYYQRELLFREGLGQEVYRSDPSVRELIIELMQQRATGEIPDPSGKELVNFYADNIDRYYSEASISFSQRVFRKAPENPEQLRASLNQGDAISDDMPWQGKDFPDYGASMIRGLFGQTLLEVLQQQPLGGWQGPYESREGWHFFRVDGRMQPVLLSFERVEDQVRADYQAAAVADAVAVFVDARRARYPLEIRPD